jgi:hypothetical protein
MVLQFDQGLTERREIAFCYGGQDSQENQSAEPFGDPFGHGREIRECPELARAVKTTWSGRLNDENRPILRKRHASDERRWMLLGAPASVHDQASVQKPVEPDPGTSAAPRKLREQLK